MTLPHMSPSHKVIDGALVKLDRMGRPTRPVMDRFAEKIVQNGDCWRWTASLDTRGYAQLWDGKKIRKAYKIAYELFIGPVPDGLTLDHLCRNRWCVNPYCLDPVPMAVNHRRGVLAKTHCRNGHDYVEPNIYVDRTGARHCRICRAEQMRAWKERQAVAA